LGIHNTVNKGGKASRAQQTGKLSIQARRRQGRVGEACLMVQQGMKLDSIKGRNRAMSGKVGQGKGKAVVIKVNKGPVVARKGVSALVVGGKGYVVLGGKSRERRRRREQIMLESLGAVQFAFQLAGQAGKLAHHVDLIKVAAQPCR